MSLNNEFEVTGNWLFKHRSFLPLIIVPFLFYCLLKHKNNFYNTLFYAGLTVSLIGECVRRFTIAFVPAGTPGRNTKQQLATSLNRTGIYSTVRHPLYLGNFFMFLGPFIFTGNIYGIIILILAFWIYYERIMFAEEAYLIKSFGIEYENWSVKTPAFIPNIFLYSPINSKFSLTKVLEREYSGICGVFLIFTIVLVFRNY
jgi:protein-S-isoprenylcysteine O-methyltransferase Ste14